MVNPGSKSHLETEKLKKKTKPFYSAYQFLLCSHAELSVVNALEQKISTFLQKSQKP